MAPKKKGLAKKNPWTDEERLFSEKSKLISIDLHNYFADPKAWEVLTEAEKEEIRTLLPPHIVLSDDGLLPQEFLKYDNDWRNALRQFQIDLEAGRYNADWLSEAAQAMEERAAGEFDDFKEKEFEEFWGQKQRLPNKVLAGEMTTLKLETLVEAGMFRVGDVWSYSRNIGRGKEKTLLEKDVTIIAIESGKLTFSIPPGQYKYLIKKQDDQSEVSSDMATFSNSLAEVPKNQQPELPDESTEVRIETKGLPTETEEPCKEIHSPTTPLKRRIENEVEVTKQCKKVMHDHTKSEDEIDVNKGENPTDATKTLDFAMDTTSKVSNKVAESKENNSASGSSMTYPDAENLSGRAPLLKDEIHDTNEISEESIVLPDRRHEGPATVTVAFPQVLEARIIEIDGRFTGVRVNNAWKVIRCKRDNQDMGSLWEMREEYYVRRLAH